MKEQSSRARVQSAVTSLLAAAVVYEHETDHNGENPIWAGARLRLAAKAYAKAAREAGVLP